MVTKYSLRLLKRSVYKGIKYNMNYSAKINSAVHTARNTHFTVMCCGIHTFFLEETVFEGLHLSIINHSQ